MQSKPDLYEGYAKDADGRPSHRRIYREVYGAPPRGWHVHHIDYDKLNNDPANLIALPPKYHTDLHSAYATPQVGRTELEKEVAILRGIHERLHAELSEIRQRATEMETRIYRVLGIKPFRSSAKAAKEDLRKIKKRAKQATHKARNATLKAEATARRKWTKGRTQAGALPANDIAAILRKKATEREKA